MQFASEYWSTWAAKAIIVMDSSTTSERRSDCIIEVDEREYREGCLAKELEDNCSNQLSKRCTCSERVWRGVAAREQSGAAASFRVGQIPFLVISETKVINEKFRYIKTLPAICLASIQNIHSWIMVDRN